MIGVSSGSRSFTGLGRYLVVGRDEVNEGRVAWTSARNLPTDDPELAAKIMQATAAQNPRVSQPVYHVSLSFDPHDAVDRATMERVADRVITELKLDEYQAIIVAHADRRHPHMHILVNRIHPETGRAWDRWRDHTAIQRALQQQEKALGLRIVEGRSTNQEADRGATKDLSADFDAHDRVTELSRQQYQAERDVSAGQATVQRIDVAVERVDRAEAAFDGAMTRTYRDARSAKEAFVVTAAESGASEAARRMRERPEEFGELIRTEAIRGILRRQPESDLPARAAAREAAAHGLEFVEARRELERTCRSEGLDLDTRRPTAEAGRDMRELAVGSLDAARERLRATTEAQRGLPTKEQLEHRLSQGLRRLSPQEVQQLRHTLSPQRLTLAYQLRKAVRDAAMGRDLEE